MANFDDWLAICNLKAAYCRLLDAKDWAGWAQLFAEDVEVDVRESGGTLEHGRDAFVASVRGSIETTKTCHQVHSPEITIAVDQASAVWAMEDRLIWDDGRTMRGYGHYHEDYEKRGGRWWIKRQRLTRLFMEA